jgi:multidrug resistance efflux pump
MNSSEPIATPLPSQPTVSGKNRRPPTHWQSIRLFIRTDLGVIARSWLCRGFFLATLLLTVLELKGMQAEQKAASQMLEAVYATYLLIWMHGIIFIAGSALVREAECLNDAILCRGVTRGEYIVGKLFARCLAVLLMMGCVLVPASIWAIRQDTLLRTQDGFVTSSARNTKVEAWDPKKVFSEVAGSIKEMSLKVGDSVHGGDILAVLDDRTIFDELENERRGEENARNEVNNANRRIEDARRNVAQAEDALEKAERSLVAKDLLTKAEQADRQTDIRSRKRDLRNAESALKLAEDALPTAERAVENAMTRVRDARRRLGYVTVTAPISGYVTEVLVQPGQYVSPGTQLFVIAPLDEYQVRVPIYKFEEFKRLKTGLTAYVKIEKTEYKGTIERLGAMTQPDRWGRDSNYGVVRFKGDGTLGLLGLPADVKLMLPPPPKDQISRATAILNVLTGRASGESPTRSASVTVGWMVIALGKVIGTACLLVTLTLLVLLTFRNNLVAILSVIGFYHISNLLFDFVGLKDLSYLEMVGTMEKVLGGFARPGEELITLAWLFGIAAALGVLATVLFISRDPSR